MWKETTRITRNKKIFEEEFEEFLPSKILDFHVHISPVDALISNVHPVNAGGHSLSSYTINELETDMLDLYPRRESFAVCFGWCSRELDLAKNNRYVATSCDKERFFPVRMIMPEEDPEVVERDTVTQGFLGFKPYLTFVQKPKEEITVRDMIPDSFMEIANRQGLFVVLHIPRKQRLADLENRKQVLWICENYPSAKIILAHVGRAYFMKNIVGNLEPFIDIPNLYFDLAMVSNWEVLEYLFSRASLERILYATDIPISLAAGASIEVNHQYSYLTPVPWDLSICDSDPRLVYTSFAYEEIRAIKKAVQRIGLGRRFVEDLFYHNGNRLLQKPRTRKISDEKSQ
ncbi:MAG: amidohydrolase family protein [Candidatus Ratteibacteria bacterium]|jgi:predicted TIM-barrel fold metal-dependent hydrolase